MKSIALLTMAGLIAGCSVNNLDGPSTESQSERRAMGGVTIDGKIPTDVRRLSVIVRDMEKSLAFYRDVLGLKINYDTEVTLSGVNLPVGEPGTRARLVLLNANDPFIGWVGLMELVDPPLPDADEPYPRRLGPGGAVLVVNTDDAKARCAAAATVEGVTMTGPARLQIYPGRNDGPEIRVMGCNVFDPDGIAVEINQILD